jgi:hypothetical protein
MVCAPWFHFLGVLSLNDCVIFAASYVEARAAGLRKAIKSAGGSGALPLVLVENSSRCGTNDEVHRQHCIAAMG